MRNNIEESLKDMGHDVVVFYYNDSMTINDSSLVVKRNKKLIEKFKSENKKGIFDLIFMMVYDNFIFESTLKELKKYSVCMLNYHVDTLLEIYMIK